MKTMRLPFVLLLLAMAAVLAWLLLQPQPQPSPTAEPGTPAPASGSRSSGTAPDPASTNVNDAVPTGAAAPSAGIVASQVAAVSAALQAGSLRGSMPDGAISLDARGRLVLDLGLRHWLDYHLSLVGEVDVAAIRSYLAHQLGQQHAPAVVAAVLEAFDRQVRYLQAVDQLAATLRSADAAQRLQYLKDLRRQHLGAQQAAAFYADEEAYADYTLAMQELRRDPPADAVARAEREARLIEALPPNVRAPLLEHQQDSATLEQARHIAAATADPLQRYAERERAFGTEAAARLELLDREQADWRARLAADQAERARLQADPRLDAAARAQALQAWRAQHFDAAERARVEALEAIGQLDG